METFRTRFRFRVQKKLNIKSPEYRFRVGQHDVVLSPQLPDVNICDSEWLVINARGLESEAEAKEFAEKLKAAAEFSSVASRLGIDSGVDLPTFGFGQTVKDHAHREAGIILRDNVHGIDVFVDDPNVRIGHGSIDGFLLKEPDSFLFDISAFLEVAKNTSAKAKDIILLLNYALMRPEPVAQIVFAFSAVEMLGQKEKWSSNQIQLLEQLATDAEKSTAGTADERSEVSAAITRGAHRLGLRQGVLRLLTRLELNHLKERWDVLYGQRNTLIHGLAPKPGADYTQLAFDVVTLCGQILLKAIAEEAPQASKHVDKFYKT